jgi:4-amino-4-deoxy-L-arabinose transferase-like glycosyltransferase
MNLSKHTLVWIAIVAIAIFLRTVGLTYSPPSLYWEEVALGYDAYSLSQTGRDHHGNWWPVVALESFGDWKPAGYVYALLPLVWLFGLSETVVRLPAVLAGVGIVIVVGKIARLVAEESEQGKRVVDELELIAMALTAVSPWALQFSRAAWEVNVATFLLTFGIWRGWRILTLKSPPFRRLLREWLWVVLALVAAMYTYHATRLLAPLAGVGLYAWWSLSVKHWRKEWWLTTAGVGVVGVLLCVPLLLSLGSAQLNQRFAETSRFSDAQLVIEAVHSQELSGVNMANSWFHRYFQYAKSLASGYVSHLRLDFWVLTGDINPRHSVGWLGLLYPFEIIWLLAGLVGLMSKQWKVKAPLLVWMTLGILPAALTVAVPHALRILPILPPIMVLLAIGVQQCKSWTKSTFPKLAFLVWPLLLITYLAAVSGWGWLYFGMYRNTQSQEWQYGYREMVGTVTAWQHTHPDQKVAISREYGRPAMYYWFYTLTDPRRVQAANATAAKDQGEFLEFESIQFARAPGEVKDAQLVVGSKEFVEQATGKRSGNVIKEVKNLQGDLVWQVWEGE